LLNIEHEIASVETEIIRLETKVTQQRARIQSLELCGGDTKLSYLLLRNFEDYLAHYYDRRGQLLEGASGKRPRDKWGLVIRYDLATDWRAY
jgi:hypothetical protein